MSRAVPQETVLRSASKEVVIGAELVAQRRHHAGTWLRRSSMSSLAFLTAEEASAE